MDAFLDYAEHVWPWAVALVGVALAALANGIETGFYRLNRIRLRLRSDSGDRRAKTLLGLVNDLRGMIIVCLLGTNCGGFIATAVATMLVASAGWVRSNTGVEIVTTALVAPLLFVFADVVPKCLFTAEADHWMYPLARPLRAVHRALCGVGVVPALNGISNLVLRVARKQAAEGADPFHPRQRLRAVLGEGAAEGVISGYQHELASKVLGLREQLVRAVMIPMGRVTAAPVDMDRAAFLEQLRQHSYSRLPVWEGRSDNVIGIVHILDVLGARDAAGGTQHGNVPCRVPLDLRAMMSREVAGVPPDMTVAQAMVALRKARAAMAVVRDAKGRALGIITIKDLVEEIVGELAAW
jgi:CBS domain containing-hemolysin-like protein